ncbi:MAG: hypothetical protein F4013_03665 [Gammaproteobacteria bacterium]|nr:hypothetical protein [Gammaproteobacteria bacterium]
MTKRKRAKLTDIELEEISLVSRPAQAPALALITKADARHAKADPPMTTAVMGHAHAVGVRGEDGTLELVLGFAEGEGPDAVESHTHPVIRTRNGFEVGMLEGHTHTLPDLSRLVTRFLTTTGEGMEKIADALTGEESGHAHGLSVSVYDGQLTVHVEAATAAGAASPHSHAVARGADGGLILGASEGHSHELPDVSALVSGIAKAEDPAEDLSGLSIGDLFERLRKERAAMTPEQLARSDELLTKLAGGLKPETAAEDATMSDELRKRERAESDLEALAARCHAENPHLTEAQAYAKALATPRGQALYAAAYAPVEKADGPEVRLMRWVAEQVEARLAKEADEWASVEELAALRKRLDAEVCASREYAERYREVYFPAPVEKADEELAPVTLGLLSKSECERDPEAALEKLAKVEAYRQGITLAKAYAGFVEPDSIGHELMLRANEAQRARSAAALAG